MITLLGRLEKEFREVMVSEPDRSSSSESPVEFREVGGFVYVDRQPSDAEDEDEDEPSGVESDGRAVIPPADRGHSAAPPESPGDRDDGTREVNSSSEAERAESPPADQGDGAAPPEAPGSDGNVAERAERPHADRGHGAEPPESPGDQDDETREFMEEVVLPLRQRMEESARRTLASLEARRAQPGERGWTHWDQHALDMVRREVESWTARRRHGSSGV